MKYFSPFTQMPGQNILINGNFDIWQRGTIDLTKVAVSNVFLLADRWGKTIITGGMAMPATYTQERGIPTPGDILQSSYCFMITSDTACVPAATTHIFHEQRIEKGTSRFAGLNRQLTITFWAMCTTPSQYIGVALRQNYGTGGSAEEIIPGIAILAATGAWRKYQYTFTLNTLAGKTVAADNYLSLMIGFTWGTTPGAAYYNTASAEPIGATGSKFITQIKLEVGQNATSFEARSVGDELIACQRYFRRLNPAGVLYGIMGIGQAWTALVARSFHPLSPVMYKIPAVTQKGNLALTKSDGTFEAVTSLGISGFSTVQNVVLSLTVAANLVAGNATMLVANNDATGDVWFDAEI